MHTIGVLSVWLATAQWTRCTPSHYTCILLENGFFRYGKSPRDPCKKLYARNITSILFIGDSYVRHAYQGVAAVLTRNFDDASLVHGAPLECRGARQTEFAKCRFHLNTTITACGITLSARIGHTPIPRVYPNDFLEHTVIVWGFGNHPSDSAWGDGDRPTIGDVQAYTQDVLLPTCRCVPPLAINHVIRSHLDNFEQDCVPWSSEWSKRVVFLQSHFRPSPGRYAGETREAQQLFFDRMPEAIRTVCNITRMVDTYTPTRQLASHGGAMKYAADTAHWGWAVNLVKAEILLDALSRAQSSFPGPSGPSPTASRKVDPKFAE